MGSCCTILLPVYNAFEDLDACMESLFRTTALASFRLILLDDASTDPRITPFLAGIAAKYDNVLLMPSAVNKGYVRTCNRGLRVSEGDVVLLNSDTLLTPGWLERMQTCLYSHDSIASVTPLSNNATICSVPVFMQDQALPMRISLDAYAGLIGAVSAKMYPRVPVGVGFCMLLRREALDGVGLLDEESFGRGYGEENDWCYRAMRQGWQHALCDDAFVCHKGCASFGQSRTALVAEHDALLFKRYPELVEQTQEFMRNNPLQPVQQRIAWIYRLMDTDKPWILMTAHNPVFIAGQHSGGVESHALQLFEQLDGMNAMVLWMRPEDRFTVRMEARVEGTLLTGSFSLRQPVQAGGSSDEVRELLCLLCDALPLSMVHIQHWLNWPLDVFHAFHGKVPVFLTLHDYYALCPKVNLLDDAGRFCGVPEEDACAACHGLSAGKSPHALKAWRSAMAAALMKMDRIYAPSDYVKDLMLSVFPGIPCTVRPHGVPKVSVSERGRRKDGLFKVAVMGNMTPPKGSGILKAMVEANQDRRIEWHVLGPVLDEELKAVKRKDLVFHGAYGRGALPELLGAIGADVVCLPSIWPETYSYTLTEAIQAGYPVLVLDYGAQAQRLRENGCGWVIPAEQGAQGLLGQICLLSEDPRSVERVRGICLNMVFPTVQEVSARYLEDYRSVMPAARRSSPEALRGLADALVQEPSGVLRQALAYQVGLDTAELKLLYTSSLYVDDGHGFSEQARVSADLGIEPSFRIVFSLSDYPVIRSIRWDPVEGLRCMVRVEEIECRQGNRTWSIDPRFLRHNGTTTTMGDRFDHMDPAYSLAIQGPLDAIVFRGKWHPGTRYLASRQPEIIATMQMLRDTVPPLLAEIPLADIRPGIFTESCMLTGIQGISMLKLQFRQDVHAHLRIDEAWLESVDGTRQEFEPESLPHAGQNLGDGYYFDDESWVAFPVNIEAPILFTMKGALALGGLIYDINAPREQAWYVSHLYLDEGQGFSEQCKAEMPPMRWGKFLLKFKPDKPYAAIRWDPMQEGPCSVRLDAVTAVLRGGRHMNIPLQTITHNGVANGDWWVFPAEDPWILFPNLPGQLAMLQVKGILIKGKEAYQGMQGKMKSKGRLTLPWRGKIGK